MAVDVLEGLLEEDDEVVQVRFKKKKKVCWHSEMFCDSRSRAEARTFFMSS